MRNKWDMPVGQEDVTVTGRYNGGDADRDVIYIKNWQLQSDAIKDLKAKIDELREENTLNSARVGVTTHALCKLLQYLGVEGLDISERHVGDLVYQTNEFINKKEQKPDTSIQTLGILDVEKKWPKDRPIGYTKIDGNEFPIYFYPEFEFSFNPEPKEILEWEQQFCNKLMNLIKACFEEGKKDGLMSNISSLRNDLHNHIKDKLNQPEGTYLKVVVGEMENFYGRELANVEFMYKGTPSNTWVDAVQLVRAEPIKNKAEEPCLICGKTGIGHGYCKECLEAENE